MSGSTYRWASTLLLLFTGAVAGCGNDGGDHGPKPYAFLLTTDVACYGASIHLDLTALPSDAVSAGEIPCRLGSDVPAECVADFTRNAAALDLAVRGCSLPSGSTLVECDLDVGRATSVSAAATIACGCGCQNVCPAVPSVCAYQSADSPCVPPPSPGSPSLARSRRITSVTEQIGASTTTTTYCGTCCDVSGSALLTVGDSEPVMEIHVATAETIYLQSGCFHDAYCTDLSGATGPGFARITGSELEFCASTTVATITPTSLALCDISNGGISQPGPGRVIRALDRNYRPLAVPPPVSVGYPD